MIKFLLTFLILSSWALQAEIAIKQDSTVVLTVDDFSPEIRYPVVANNSKEVHLIIKNRSKIAHLFALHKNQHRIKFIQVPSMSSRSESVAIIDSDSINLRPLSPPNGDLRIFPYVNEKN